MPCNSDYLNATATEIAASHVECLLDELNGWSFNADWWGGYHPRVYNNGFLYDKNKFDARVAELCEKLSKLDPSVYSLELQIWWRDHQRADAARTATEATTAKRQALRTSGLAKLTEAEREALGL